VPEETWQPISLIGQVGAGPSSRENTQHIDRVQWPSSWVAVGPALQFFLSPAAYGFLSKDAYIVQGQGSHPSKISVRFRILLVDPPGENSMSSFLECPPPGKSQFRKRLFFSCPASNTYQTPHACTGRVDVAENSIRTQGIWPVRMHIIFPEHTSSCCFGKVRVDVDKSRRMEREVQAGKPRVFPFIGHGDNVPAGGGCCQVIVPLIAPGQAASRRAPRKCHLNTSQGSRNCLVHSSPAHRAAPSSCLCSADRFFWGPTRHNTCRYRPLAF